MMPNAPTQTQTGTGKTQADELLNIALSFCNFFHTPDGTTYARMVRNNRAEIIPLHSVEFREQLSREYFVNHNSKSAPGARAVNDALSVLSGIARHDRPEAEVYHRIAPRGANIVLDLCNAAGEVVVIEPGHWHIETNSPVYFRRPRGLLPLPTPTHGGNLDALGKLINLPDDLELGLVKAWLSFCLNPDGPYPILSLRAEQGSGKSYATHLLKSILDPSTTPPRAEPRNVDDLMIATRANWVMAYDNIANLPDWLSDTLCRLATGAGFGKRQNYADLEEVTLTAKRPLILNGIVDATARGDFLSRAIIIDLPALDDTQRREEKELRAEFENAHSGLLGGLLDTAALALAQRGNVHPARLPRMADFARWCAACQELLGFNGTFVDYYSQRQEANSRLALDSSLVAKVLLDFLFIPRTWEGKISDLFVELKSHCNASSAHDLPKSPNWLSNELRRLEPALKQAGVKIVWPTNWKHKLKISL